ncbi:MAG: hypothetical protein EOP07_10190 [Proteobacteria bacterium]|jgi:hypothetical protein|nr:MAG: hypothetical protein EOP07_10190 [Pseudomonadota bacterium]
METRNDRETKVISLKDRANQSSPKPDQSSPAPQAAPSDFDFATIMKRNSENANRSLTDRDKANKGVIRSYRLKH